MITETCKRTLFVSIVLALVFEDSRTKAVAMQPLTDRDIAEKILQQ